MKTFVEAQKASARVPLVDALTSYSTTCDKVERHIVIEPPHGDYFLTTYVSFDAFLSKTASKAWLSVVYHGDTWIFANRIKVAADEFRWTSPPLRFAHDNDDTVWEVAHLPYTKALQSVVKRIVVAKEAIIRFEGTKGYEDLIVTDEMKRDLKLMMDGLAAIKIP